MEVELVFTTVLLCYVVFDICVSYYFSNKDNMLSLTSVIS